jgi:dienelactone hydrolase
MQPSSVKASKQAITIHPEKALMDQELSIQLQGFNPGEMVRVTAKTCGGQPQNLASSAVFQIGLDGCVDLGTQKPVSGSYAWVDAMGLIWSLEPVIDPHKPRRAIAYDVTQPLEIVFEVEVNNVVVAAKTVQRLWMAEGVQRSIIHDKGLRGIFFLPPGPGPHPAIIVVTGSGGGLNETRAAMFASHGIAALALAHFAYEDLPKGLFEIPLEYFETAAQWLTEHPAIDGNRLAITGGSRGGELSLVLGSTFPQFKAVVAYVPSSLAWGGFGVQGNPKVPAWVYRGQALPYITHTPSEEVIPEDPTQPIPLTPVFLEAMEDKATAQAAEIPVEKINGPVLLISGQDDQMWPSTKFSEMVMERLNRYQFKHPFEHLSYPGAGHSIASPYIPLPPSHGIHPVDGRDYTYGGNPKDQAYAIADSWQRVLDFLKLYL